jgi:prepilin peptidase CpaA
VDNILQGLAYIDFAIITCLLLFISWQDILLRVISNSSLIVLLCLIVPFIAIQQRVPNIVAALTVIIVLFPLFIYNIMGGGDIKLMAVLSLSFSWHQVADFFFIIIFLGGVVGLVGIIFFRQSVRERGIPYGVPISLAFILFNAVVFN